MKKDQELFLDVLERFKEQYPNREIALQENLVCINGKPKFNIEGFNLLYNLKRLCENLKQELI